MYNPSVRFPRLDTGNRRSFRQEGSVVSLGGKPRSWENDAAAPLCVDRVFVEALFRKLECRENSIISHEVPALTLTQTHRGNLTEGLYIGLDYEKVCFAQKNFS